jgi:hypothetical protein
MNAVSVVVIIHHVLDVLILRQTTMIQMPQSMMIPVSIPAMDLM